MRREIVLAALGVYALSIAAGLAPGAAAHGHRDPADAIGPLDLRHVAVAQVRQNVRLKVKTSGAFGLGTLSRNPDARKPWHRFLCLQIHRTGHNLVRQLCFGKNSAGDADMLGYARLRPDGSLRSWKGIHARVQRPHPNTVVAHFRPGGADLEPHRYRWRYVSQWTGRGCEAPHDKAHAKPRPNPCFDRSPNHHDARFHLRPVQPVGCKDSGPTPVFGGSSAHKRVALTFDDGPGVYTPKILSILRHKHVRGTFFEIGAQVPGYASTSRSIIEAGEELANHSLHHETDPGRSSMAATSANIKAATGFTPCLFRPPGGAFNSRVVGDASGLGMTTVIWNVDPRDWSRPGTGAIYSRVVSATRPGSIVLMHDGGGDRSETVAALPQIIDTLRGRGYRFVTVSKLLHQRTIWGQAR